MGNLCIPCNQYEDATTPSSAYRYYDSALDEFGRIANGTGSGFDNGVGNGNNPLEGSYHVPPLEVAIPTLHVSPRLSALTCEVGRKPPAQVPCSESTATGCNKSHLEVLSSRGPTRKSTPKSTPRQPFPKARQNTPSTRFRKRCGSKCPTTLAHQIVVHPPKVKHRTIAQIRDGNDTDGAPHVTKCRHSRRPSYSTTYTPTKAIRHYSPQSLLRMFLPFRGPGVSL